MWTLVISPKRSISSTGGPPCQPFSLGGKHRADDDGPRHVVRGGARRAGNEAEGLDLENVKGLTRTVGFSVTDLAYIVDRITFPELIRREDEGWEDELCWLERHLTGGGATLGYPIASSIAHAGRLAELLERSPPAPARSSRSQACRSSRAGAFDALFGAKQAAEEIAAADHDGDLDAKFGDSLEYPRRMRCTVAASRPMIGP